MYFWIHCNDCGSHTEIHSKGSQEFCPCSSINWKCVDLIDNCQDCKELTEIEEKRAKRS